MPHAYPHLLVWFYNWFPKFEGVGEGWAWHFLKWQEEVGKRLWLEWLYKPRFCRVLAEWPYTKCFSFFYWLQFFLLAPEGYHHWQSPPLQGFVRLTETVNVITTLSQPHPSRNNGATGLCLGGLPYNRGTRAALIFHTEFWAPAGPDLGSESWDEHDWTCQGWQPEKMKMVLQIT